MSGDYLLGNSSWQQRKARTPCNHFRPAYVHSVSELRHSLHPHSPDSTKFCQTHNPRSSTVHVLSSDMLPISIVYINQQKVVQLEERPLLSFLFYQACVHLGSIRMAGMQVVILRTSKRFHQAACITRYVHCFTVLTAYDIFHLCPAGTYKLVL